MPHDTRPKPGLAARARPTHRQHDYWEVSVQDMSVSGAPAESLRDALERDHREVDDAVEGYTNGSASGTRARLDLERATKELRRHIYVEEELLFPPLRQAGLLGPILVMLREHGQMWPILDALDQGLAAGVEDHVLRTTCRDLSILLQQHNPKEEQILYPQVDRVVGADAGIDVREFLDAGQLPVDWMCQYLRPERGGG
jgi:regulator of cell morphogenesis and NO signaling